MNAHSQVYGGMTGRVKTAGTSWSSHKKGSAKDMSSGTDWWLFAVAMVLLAFGLTMVFSAGHMPALRLHNDPWYFFKRQVLFAVAGLGCLWLFYVTPRSLIEKLQYPFLLASMALVALTLTPLGAKVNGASRWIELGLIRIQPMELAKIALVVYLGFFFGTKQHIVKSFSRGIIPPFLITGVFCGMFLLQPDFGGATVFAMLLFFICLVGGTRLIYLFASAVLAGGSAVLLVIMEPYRFKRLTAFMDPEADPSGSGYQLVQSFLALGAGGVSGVGLGAGKQKLFYLPEAHTDFIMAVLGEELGFIGISLVFILLCVLCWRGFRLALRQGDLRGRLTVFGLTMMLAVPMLLNMAVVSGSVPSKGVPMPFFSYGGTSLVSSLICVGLLMNYSRYSLTPDQLRKRWE